MMARTFFLVILFSFLIAGSQAQVTVSTVTGEIYGSGGISRGPDGSIYIANVGQTAANERGTEVLRYDPVADTIGVFATGLRSPTGNAFDSQGNFFQSNSFGSEVSIIDSNGTVNIFTIAGLFSPHGIAVDADDNLYVCNCSNNTVQRITPSKASAVFSSHPEFDCPHGIAIDSMGTLYMTNFNDGKVFRIDTLGIGTLLATIPGGNNGYITYNPGNGALYVNSLGSSTLYLMTTEGLFSPFVGTGTRGNLDGAGSLATLSRPNGLALSVTGDSLYLNSLVSLTSTSLPRNPALLRRITGLLPPPTHIAVP
ncbi:MAG: NHL repeat-containing protein, partial [Bacteroidota bacterium]